MGYQKKAFAGYGCMLVKSVTYGNLRVLKNNFVKVF